MSKRPHEDLGCKCAACTAHEYVAEVQAKFSAEQKPFTLRDCIEAVRKLREEKIETFDGYYRHPIDPTSFLGKTIRRLREQGFEVLSVASAPAGIFITCKAQGRLHALVWELQLGETLRLPWDG